MNGTMRKEDYKNCSYRDYNQSFADIYQFQNKIHNQQYNHKCPSKGIATKEIGQNVIEVFKFCKEVELFCYCFVTEQCSRLEVHTLVTEYGPTTPSHFHYPVPKNKNRVMIYFQQTSVEIKTKIFRMGFVDFISGIGGGLGLFFGIGLFETLVLIYDAVSKTLNCATKVQPIDPHPKPWSFNVDLKQSSFFCPELLRKYKESKFVTFISTRKM